MIKYPVKVVLKSSNDHTELIPQDEGRYARDEFYSNDGTPQEHFSYCKYQLNIGLLPSSEEFIAKNNISTEDFVKRYGYDWTTLALVINAKIPYLRCHYDTMGHSYPCGRGWCSSSENPYSTADTIKRDSEYPIVAYGIAAIFAWDLEYDNDKDDFVLPCPDADLANLYYSRGLADFFASHSGRSYSSLSTNEKERMYLQVAIQTEEKCRTLNKLDDYPLLQQYADEYVSFYMDFLQNKQMEVEIKIKETIHPRVFISYSHDTEEHKNWVLKLASDLRSHGVDVTLDQWDLRLGDDLPFFMEQGLSSSSLVLCVCSDTYVQKANAGKGGAGYEKKILAADLMKDVEKNYVIPVMRNTVEKNLPYFLAGNLYVDFTGADYRKPYTDLLYRIYDEDIKAKPALGVNPFRDNSVSGMIDTMVNIQMVDFSNPNFSGEVVFDYLRNSGKYRIGNGDYGFEIHWSECGNDCIYCYRDGVKRIGYNADIEIIPSETPDVSLFDFSSRTWTVYVGQIVILENGNGKLAAIKVTDVKRPIRGKGASVTFEYLIYTD